MKPNRGLAATGIELAAVLLITALIFSLAKRTAMAQRGYAAIGGEYMLLLLPAVYYAVKRTAIDWLADLRDMKERGEWFDVPL